VKLLLLADEFEQAIAPEEAEEGTCPRNDERFGTVSNQHPVLVEPIDLIDPQGADRQHHEFAG
jgi:hypothetical protein